VVQNNGELSPIPSFIFRRLQNGIVSAVSRFGLIMAAGFLISSLNAAFAVQKAVVIVPVADVWSVYPGTSPALGDDQRETQALYGERVRVRQTRGAWARIEALDQPEFSHHQKWEGYPGWIDRRAVNLTTAPNMAEAVVASTWTIAMEPETAPDVWLSLGSFLRPAGKTDDLWVISTPRGDRCINFSFTRKLLPAQERATREAILSSAGKMMGVAYLWGGLTAAASPPQPLVDKQTKFGVDCSGLVHLAYRVNGLTVPRDSHEQWMKAAKLKRGELLPADLIFSASADKPEKIVHVTLYAGGEYLLEAPQTGKVVRKVSFKEKYGAEFLKVESGQTVGDRVIYFGRLLEDGR